MGTLRLRVRQLLRNLWPLRRRIPRKLPAYYNKELKLIRMRHTGWETISRGRNRQPKV